MAELTIAEAKPLYKTSEEAKALILTKFTKDELEGKKIPTQEEFNKFFEEEILSKIDQSKTSFPDKTSFSKIRLFDSNGEWLIDYDYDQKNQHFWYSSNKVYSIFMDKFSLQDIDRHRLMKSLVEKYFNLHLCQPEMRRHIMIYK